MMGTAEDTAAQYKDVIEQLHGSLSEAVAASENLTSLLLNGKLDEVNVDEVRAMHNVIVVARDMAAAHIAEPQGNPVPDTVEEVDEADDDDDDDDSDLG